MAIVFLGGIVAAMLLAAAYSYERYRGQENGATLYRLFLASLFAEPLLLVLFLQFPGLILLTLFGSPLTWWIGNVVFNIVYLAHLFCNSPVGMVYYAVAAACLWSAWAAPAKSRFDKIWLGIYSVVLLYFAVFCAWWCLTGQEWTFP